LTALTLSNAGQLTASGDAHVHAQTLDNRAGSVTAGNALDVAASGTLDNTGGTLSGAETRIAAASIDNTHGSIDGDALAVATSGDLLNRDGKLAQYGARNQTINAGGALDNAGGTIASNANNPSVIGQSIANDGGAIQHAGAGVLVVDSKGALSNVAGQLVTNGALVLRAALALNNRQGAIQAARRADVSGASIDNTAGRIVSLSGDGLSVSAADALNNGAGGMIGSNGSL
ncbi:hypothetical protein, partial [Caballeronia ptereochthonis]|uniref:hypothetical protein n=1 Tax=Caballeronia ptereochthonis TaxID=1777144 RepID=UPI000AAE58A5